MTCTVTTQRRRHDDAPETDAAFSHLSGLPDGRERQALRDEIVEAWMPMAERIAGKYRGRGESVEDLTQVAALGLVKAVDRYDPGRGNAFESYAVPTIVGEIKRHFRDHMWAVHVPRRVQEARNKVRGAVKDLAPTNSDRQPGVAEIAEYAQLSEDDVRAGLEALDSFATVSLDARLTEGDHGYSLADALGEPDTGFDLVVDREALKPALARLPERERTILYLRFFRDMTQTCIAERLGVSQMHVSRLLSSCCASLREEVLADASGAGHSPRP
ncbi:RNA polymerase sigma factor SigF [Streptomyces sp. NBC_00659]|uniref:RNA polymerase sigma factor SigF n=1 Tax=Streptomyces sp. NBC_00659 TaxID=2903669 RepID=UPI002E362BF4|nr:RNA polymerase sigma factor SigF [Streptomyces sp. NBC_00659]